jgi:hypothetical protein
MHYKEKYHTAPLVTTKTPKPTCKANALLAFTPDSGPINGPVSSSSSALLRALSYASLALALVDVGVDEHAIDDVYDAVGDEHV